MSARSTASGAWPGPSAGASAVPRRLVAGILAAVAVGAVAAAWFEEPPALTAADAADAAEDAFDAAGLDASLQGDPVPATYATRSRAPVAVWSVLVTVRDELVQLELEQSGARPVAIDDRTFDGTSYVLSELEYESVVRHVDDPALARIVRRNIAITVAGVLVVAVALALAAATALMEEPEP